MKDSNIFFQKIKKVRKLTQSEIEKNKTTDTEVNNNIYYSNIPYNPYS